MKLVMQSSLSFFIWAISFQEQAIYTKVQELTLDFRPLIY